MRGVLTRGNSASLHFCEILAEVREAERRAGTGDTGLRDRRLCFLLELFAGFFGDDLFHPLFQHFFWEGQANETCMILLKSCIMIFVELKKEKILYSLKRVGASGQITLGKKYAGQTVQVVEDTKGDKITLVFGHFIPKAEQWLHEEPHRGKLDRAIHYAETHPPRETKLGKK